MSYALQLSVTGPDGLFQWAEPPDQQQGNRILIE